MFPSWAARGAGYNGVCGCGAPATVSVGPGEAFSKALLLDKHCLRLLYAVFVRLWPPDSVTVRPANGAKL